MKSNKQLEANRFLSFFFQKDYKNKTFLDFFRVSVGLFAIIHFLSCIRDFQKLFGKNGIIPSDIQELWLLNSNYIITLPKIISFFETFKIPEHSILNCFILAYLLFAVFLTTGLFTRVSAFFLLVLQLAIIKGAGIYMYGVDNFMTSALFYLTIFPSGYSLSLDNMIFKNRKAINLTPFRRLIQLHLCMVYFFSGIGKALGFNWWNGEAVWKSIHLPMANHYFRFDFSWLAENHLLLIFLGWSIIIIETLYPIFIWIPKTRKLWLWLTISMHFGIAIVLNLYFFATLMIILNLTAFYFTPSAEKTK